MEQNFIRPDAMTGDSELLTTAAASIYGLPIQELNLNNSSLSPVQMIQQQQTLATTMVPLPAFAATVTPVTPLPNVIQPALVQQIHPQQQSLLNHVQPMVIPTLSPMPTIPIQLQAEVVQQNLLMQQQQQIQQIQQIQQQRQQIQQIQQELQQQQVFPLVSIPQQMPASQPIIHNLIPEHLQQSSLATTPINGTTPALILPNNNYVNAVNMILLAAANNPVAATQINQTLIHPQKQQQPQAPIVSIPLTVQDRPTISPVFNGINPAYPGVETLGLDPPIFLVRDFLTHAECDFLIRAADGIWQPAPVVGKGAGEISPSRTSSTCFLAREDLPDYMRKVSALTSKPISHCELPQVGRYLPTQQYRHVRDKYYILCLFCIRGDDILFCYKKLKEKEKRPLTMFRFPFSPQHFDAFDLSNEDGRRFAQNGGQRVVTVLVYLNDCMQGGQTDFPAMNLQVTPRKGSAVIFFPATVDGYLDKRALHAALPAIDTKYVSQVWIRQSNYTGSPSKRLVTPMVNVSY